MKDIIKKMFNGWDAQSTLIVVCTLLVVSVTITGLVLVHSERAQKIQNCKAISTTVTEFQKCLD